MRDQTAAPWSKTHRRPGFHAALRPRTRRSGDTRILELSDLDTRAAIEAIPAGCVAVVDAMGITDAGIFGDILCQRMKVRGVAGLVTDGVVRDIAGVINTDLPVWCMGVAAPPSVAGLTFVNW
jgi:regulator of RNase E activity RraA